MANDQKALDDKIAGAVSQMSDLLADVATQATAIKTACQAIIDKIAAGGTDFSAEVAQLGQIADAATQSKAALDQIAQNLPTTPTPPPPAP